MAQRHTLFFVLIVGALALVAGCLSPSSIHNPAHEPSPAEVTRSTGVAPVQDELSGNVAYARSQGYQPIPDHCKNSDVVLVFKNPDLQPSPQDGRIYASGMFFIQFQAIGEAAMNIERFAFSFGKPIPEEARSCETPEWITGAYIQNYRIDYDPKDGFFVPINTTNVPDGEYAAAVHAYDATGQELARYYAEAIVDNGAGNERGVLNKDFIQPWPIVLPGDGEQTRDVGGLTIEFAEPIEFMEVRIDGVLLGKFEDGQTTGALKDWTPPEYDDDTAPDDTPLGKCPTTIVYQFSGGSGCRVWGPGFHWPGMPRNGQVIEVKAIDVWDNFANKVLHLGDPTIGGRISLLYPEVEITGSGQQKEADANGTARFPFVFKADGEGGLHGDILFQELPGNLTARFTKNHIMVKSGEELHSNLTAQALPGLPPGTYEIKGQVIYQHGEVEKSKDFRVSFILPQATEDVEEEAFARGTTVEAPDEEDLQQTTVEDDVPAEEGGFFAPGFGAVLSALALTGAVALAGRTRRRG